MYRASVTIEAPVEAVWAYVGDSGRAGEWSVYFHHIAPLAASPAPDGAVGALRRCFRRADETGARWDEEVVALDPLRFRAIRTFALRGFRRRVQWLAPGAAFRVEQHYEPLGPEQTRLTFATVLRRPAVPPLTWVFARFAPEVLSVFRVNLANIKAAVEARRRGDPYRRPHPYEPTHPWD
jgi:hypothetical protein